uniref:Protein binding protein n=1 Tax=Rhizophora mucronata TaxID=61149 RepID=A0A2P2IP53_RHIMU
MLPSRNPRCCKRVSEAPRRELHQSLSFSGEILVIQSKIRKTTEQEGMCVKQNSPPKRLK